MGHKLVQYLQEISLWGRLNPDDQKAVAGFNQSKDLEVIAVIKEMSPEIAINSLRLHIDSGSVKGDRLVKAEQPHPAAGQQFTTTRSRPADSVVGKEVVTRSSKRPLVVTPPLEATPKELSDHRADTHRKLAHLVSNKVAYVTGPIDGIVDSILNGFAEIIVENGAFFISKIFHGARYGWSRGKFSNDPGQ